MLFGSVLEPFSIKNRWKKRCENRCLKSHEFHEKTMRKFDVFWIEILRKIGCVRKVPNANKLIKTNGFLMISWFARFKNRFGKLQKHMKKRCRKSDAKNIGKSLKKWSKMEPKSIKKPSKNRCGKTCENWNLSWSNSRAARDFISPGKHIQVNKTHTDILQKAS